MFNGISAISFVLYKGESVGGFYHVKNTFVHTLNVLNIFHYFFRLPLITKKKSRIMQSLPLRSSLSFRL